MHPPLSPCRPRLPRGLLARLDAKIDRSAGPEGCHPWTAGLSRGQHRETAYPVIQEGGKRGKFWRVNRLVLLLEEIPAAAFEGERDLLQWLRLANTFRQGLDAAHFRCDTATCCNPAHLRWEPHAQNVSDQAQRRRQVAAEAA